MPWLKNDNHIHTEDPVLYGKTFEDIMLLLENDRLFMYPEEVIKNASDKEINAYRKFRMLAIAKREMLQSVDAAMEILEMYSDDIIKRTVPKKKVIDDDVKTAEGWEDSGLSFDDYVKENERVAGNIVNYFANVLYPHRYSSCFLQAGEPVDSVKEGLRFHTFIYLYNDEKYGEVWQYKGHCLSEGVEKGTECPICNIIK